MANYVCCWVFFCSSYLQLYIYGFLKVRRGPYASNNTFFHPKFSRDNGHWSCSRLKRAATKIDRRIRTDDSSNPAAKPNGGLGMSSVVSCSTSSSVDGSKASSEDSNEDIASYFQNRRLPSIVSCSPPPSVDGDIRQEEKSSFDFTESDFEPRPIEEMTGFLIKPTVACLALLSNVSL